MLAGGPPGFASASLAASPFALTNVDAIQQNHSVRVRTNAIKRFGKLLRKSDWKRAWDALDGRAGLVDLLGTLSVAHVRLLCKAIGRNSSAARAPGRAEAITELVQSLLPVEYPTAPHKSRDTRPLLRHYGLLVPACTFDFIRSLLDNKQSRLLQHVNRAALVQAYPYDFRTVAIDIYDGRPAPMEKYEVRPLLTSFPPVPGSFKNFSEPMTFTFRLMQCYASGPISVAADVFMGEFAEPLVLKAMRRRVPYNMMKSILDLIIAYCSAVGHEDASRYLNLGTHSLLRNLIRLWSRKKALFEEPLLGLLRMLPAKNFTKVEQLLPIIEAIGVGCRYRLLRLLLMLSKSTRVDIDQDLDLNSDAIHVWPLELFLLLPRDHSKVLLGRLIEARPAADWLARTGRRAATILDSTPLPTVIHLDTTLLMLFLERHTEGALDRAKTVIAQSRDMALKVRDQNDRAFYAKRALLLCVASGSLEMYHDTLLWARRFNRDALTTKVLYAHASVATVDGVELLAAIPAKPDRTMTADELCSSVKKANGILLALFETACNCVREPAFYARDWAAVRAIFSLTVEKRLTNMTNVTRAGIIPEGDLYDLVWKDTLDMLLIVESAGLEEAHTPLGFNTLYGPLGSRLETTIPSSKNADLLPSSHHFFDELARRRDELWQKYRPTVHPATVALPPPWPKGLAMQYLLPLQANMKFISAVSYVVAQAEKVVFMDPRYAATGIPEDEETRSAIGPFVDDYKYALDTWVSQAADHQEKEKKTKRAWEHAIALLSGQRMTNDEAVRFLGHESKLFAPLRDQTHKNGRRPYPVLPNTETPMGAAEWDPAEYQPPDTKSREIRPPVMLDCSLRPNAIPSVHVNTKFDDRIELTIPASTSPHIWSHTNCTSKPPFEVRDGVIASALLYLDSKKSSGPRLLSAPFPHSRDTRYPSVYLSEAFLLRKELQDSDALIALDMLKRDVPPPLLAELCENTIAALPLSAATSKDLEGKEHVAFTLLSILAASDRPELASGMVLSSVIDRPESSSWHRKLMSAGFLARLSAEQADRFVKSFANSICTLLEEQRKRKLQPKPANAQPTGNVPAEALIKVSTVKLLPQLLRGAESIAPGASVSIFVQLFQAASHLDIRVAIVSSLLDILRGCTEAASSQLRERIMKALEATIPIAGTLNERHPSSEKSWLVAEATGELPEMYDEGGTLITPPILGEFVQAIENSAVLQQDIRLELAERIIMPILERSMVEHDRWVKLFIQKFGAPGVNVPSLPPFPFALGRLLTGGMDVMPADTFKFYRDFVILNMDPPEALATINKKIQGSAVLLSSKAGLHWLATYNNGIQAFKYQKLSVSRMLGRELHLRDDSRGIQLAQMQSLVFEEATVLINKADVTFADWTPFTYQLAPQNQKRLEQAPWQRNARPVVEKIIQYVASLRSPGWQQDPERRPIVLPDTFAMQIWLLVGPSKSDGAGHKKRCHTFAAELENLLEGLVSSEQPYHQHFDQIKSMATQKVYPQDKACVAFALMQRRGLSYLTLPDLRDYLCAEIADALLADADKPRYRETVPDTKWLMDQWRSSTIERIRMRGLEMTKLLEQKSKAQDWSWEDGSTERGGLLEKEAPSLGGS